MKYEVRCQVCGIYLGLSDQEFVRVWCEHCEHELDEKEDSTKSES